MAIAPTRVETLVQMVDAWSADSHSKDTVMLAWRREDVADLKRLARQRRDQLGQLHGPDVKAPRGRLYAIGDVVVTLAPNHRAGLVTSQRLLVVDANPERLTAVAEDDRRITLQGDEIDSDHLDHAYALTVHRAQGATYDRAHVLAAGGGRELAYVALSRARDGAYIDSTADSLEDAVDELRADWGIERNELWITSPKSSIETELDDDVADLLDRLDDLACGISVGVELPDLI